MSAVSFSIEMPVAAVPPNVTAVAPITFVPVMLTHVPPATGPVNGETLANVGGSTYVYAPVPPVEVPLRVVTITSVSPALPIRVLPMIFVALTTVILVNAVPPMVTL